jgi:hypothetical protein
MKRCRPHGHEAEEHDQDENECNDGFFNHIHFPHFNRVATVCNHGGAIARAKNQSSETSSARRNRHQIGNDGETLPIMRHLHRKTTRKTTKERFMSLTKINNIADQLKCGCLTLNDDVAQQLNKAVGNRFSAEERAALVELEKAREAGTIKSDGIGAHRFLDEIMNKPQGRFAHGLQVGQDWGEKAQAASAAIAGGVGAVAGFAGGPAVMASSAGVGALAGIAGGRMIGSIVGFVKGLIED